MVKECRYNLWTTGYEPYHCQFKNKNKKQKQTKKPLPLSAGHENTVGHKMLMDSLLKSAICFQLTGFNQMFLML